MFALIVVLCNSLQPFYFLIVDGNKVESYCLVVYIHALFSEITHDTSNHTTFFCRGEILRCLASSIVFAKFDLNKYPKLSRFKNEVDFAQFTLIVFFYKRQLSVGQIFFNTLLNGKTAFVCVPLFNCDSLPAVY